MVSMFSVKNDEQTLKCHVTSNGKLKLDDEIYAVLRKKELHIPKYHGCSSHLCYRRVIVDWLAIISERIHLSHGILHISVSLLDKVMDKHEFTKQNQLWLLGLCCLWIAGKFALHKHHLRFCADEYGEI